MFIGHALLAFALATVAAERFEVPRERALRYGLFAGLFAAVPDVDIVYAPVGLLLRSVERVGPDMFWETANVIHRGPTHSLVLGGLLAVAVACWAVGTRRSRAASLTLAAVVLAVGTLVSGPIGGVVVLIFAVSGFVVAGLASRQGVAPRPLLGLALLGLLSHPFGDLLTGSPPPFLYPFDVVLVAERVALHPDPTGQLLAAFAVELGTVWLAIWAYTRHTDRRLLDLVSPRASLGAGYAAAALLLPAPTMEQSAHFVFSVLAISVIGAPVRPFSRGVDRLRMAVTGLTAVTVAAVAYALAYGLL
ncbi:metal-dependent hydrolase [Haloarcula sediminis]|uniref:metal-dependent hydrolase n=1 Tax=Haloarcula sediminis TaxID=3111777 RepID=UPI002D78CB4C|nr:metal-dependent hydrolase [Haloarcula sp. CK38]